MFCFVKASEISFKVFQVSMKLSTSKNKKSIDMIQFNVTEISKRSTLYSVSSYKSATNRRWNYLGNMHSIPGVEVWSEWS